MKDRNRIRERLIHAIESTRAEMTECVRRAGYCFYDAEVIRISRKLDRLLNLYYRLDNEKER